MCSLAHSDVVIDHIVPLALGGTNDPSNLTVACETCNAIKRDMDPGDAEEMINAIRGVA
jgi:5-methylcytosine-specific restriction endonuclease McrA